MQHLEPGESLRPDHTYKSRKGDGPSIQENIDAAPKGIDPQRFQRLSMMIKPADHSKFQQTV